MGYRWFLLFFLVLPVLELAVIIELGRWLGTWTAVALVLGTGAAGAILAQGQGLAVLRQIRDEMAQGRVPATGLLNGLFVLAGGVLLMTPGFITDAIGLLCLLPWTRKVGVLWLQGRIRAMLDRGTVYFYFRR